MASIRRKRIARLIREEASRMILQELWDPRLGFVTVTDVEVSGDLEHALIKVSVLGSEQDKERTLEGLESCRSYVQAAVGKLVKLRRSPHIRFELDRSIDRSARVSELLREIRPEGGEGD